MLLGILVLFVGLLVLGPVISLKVIALGKNENDSKLYKTVKVVFLSIYFYSIVFLILSAIFTQTADYYEPIDPIDVSYTAFATKHFLSVSVFYLLFIASMIIIYLKGRDLPPLALSLCMAFVIIGIILNVAIVAQYINTGRNVGGERYNGVGNGTNLNTSHHIMTIILSVFMLIRIVKQEHNLAIARQFNNKYLNKINNIIGKKYFSWALILLLPVWVVITMILILFGQEKDSLIKVWTETTTWTFSRHEHPPYLGHNGHYLCTVAACGHPTVVKPLRLGMRHNRVIIVNRQLSVANAYEEMVQTFFPKFHKIVRTVYDTCGYPISKNITNKYISDIVYILMKPLEYFFVISLYLFVRKPEELINKQYRLESKRYATIIDD